MKEESKRISVRYFDVRNPRPSVAALRGEEDGHRLRNEGSGKGKNTDSPLDPPERNTACMIR